MSQPRRRPHYRIGTAATATVIGTVLTVLSACAGTTAGTPSAGGQQAAPVAVASTSSSTVAPAAPATTVVVTTTPPPPPVTVTATTTAAPPPPPVVVTQTQKTTVVQNEGPAGGGSIAVDALVSPSGNITCGVVGGTLYCTIGVYDFDLDSCADTGSGALVSLTAYGPSDIDSCGGEILDGVDATTLDYGDVAALGDNYACTVEETGMACLNSAGFGFTLARAGFQPF